MHYVDVYTHIYKQNINLIATEYLYIHLYRYRYRYMYTYMMRQIARKTVCKYPDEAEVPVEPL